MGCAGPAVVPGGEELRVTQMLHEFDLVLRHRAKGMVAPVLAGIVRARAVPVAAQIGGHDGEVLGQPVGDLVPGDVRERVTVQQQQRWPVAAASESYLRSGGLEITDGESLEHRRSFPLDVWPITPRFGSRAAS